MIRTGGPRSANRLAPPRRKFLETSTTVSTALKDEDVLLLDAAAHLQGKTRSLLVRELLLAAIKSPDFEAMLKGSL